MTTTSDPFRDVLGNALNKINEKKKLKYIITALQELTGGTILIKLTYVFSIKKEMLISAVIYKSTACIKISTVYK